MSGLKNIPVIVKVLSLEGPVQSEPILQQKGS